MYHHHRHPLRQATLQARPHRPHPLRPRNNLEPVALVGVHEDGDGAVVDEGDLHVGAEGAKNHEEELKLPLTFSDVACHFCRFYVKKIIFSAYNLANLKILRIFAAGKEMKV